jgi:DNA-binding transcriptional ArsR family regulator
MDGADCHGHQPEERFAERQRKQALRHPLRHRIYRLLEREPANVDEIAGRLEVPRGTAGYHVRYLSRLQLIDLADANEDGFDLFRLRYTAPARPEEEDNGPAAKGIAAPEGEEALADVEDALASATAAMEAGTLLGEIAPTVTTLEVDLDEGAWLQLVAIAEEVARRVQELADRTDVRREKQNDLLADQGRLISVAFTVMAYEAAPPP